MARILVTGATGFVGRRLCGALLERGDEVVAAIRNESRAECLPRGVTTVAVGEIGPETVWEPKLLETIDAVAHLAARVHVLRETAENPAAEFQRVNVAGTERLARAAAGRVKRFVFISSLHAMRSLADERLTESSNCLPESDYGRSKLEAERVLSTIAYETGLETTILRPPPVYGPGHAGNLQKLMQAVQHGWPLPLGGVRGNQRSLIYVDNLVDAIVTCLNHPRAGGQTFLLGDAGSVSVADLIRQAGAAFGCRPRLIPIPPAAMRLAGKLTGKSAAVEKLLGSLAIDDGRIRTTLEWEPPVSREEGFAETAAWMKKAA